MECTARYACATGPCDDFVLIYADPDHLQVAIEHRDGVRMFFLVEAAVPVSVFALAIGRSQPLFLSKSSPPATLSDYLMRFLTTFQALWFSFRMIREMYEDESPASLRALNAASRDVADAFAEAMPPDVAFALSPNITYALYFLTSVRDKHPTNLALPEEFAKVALTVARFDIQKNNKMKTVYRVGAEGLAASRHFGMFLSATSCENCEGRSMPCLINGKSGRGDNTPCGWCAANRKGCSVVSSNFIAR